jgi:hypothetical protein
VGCARGKDTGSRLIHTQRRAAWDAKNRYDLPETLPLDWEVFAEAVAAHRPGNPANYRARIGRALPKMGDSRLGRRGSQRDSPTGYARFFDIAEGLLQLRGSCALCVRRTRFRNTASRAGLGAPH